MDGISVSLEGTDAIFSNLDRLGVDAAAKADRVFHRAAELTFSDSQDTCPIGVDVPNKHKAGTLKGSGKIRYPKPLEAEVSYGGASTTGEDCDYPWYVELGTYKMQAQPFLYPAFLNAVAQAQAELNGLLEK